MQERTGHRRGVRGKFAGDARDFAHAFFGGLTVIIDRGALAITDISAIADRDHEQVDKLLCPARNGEMAIHRPAFECGFNVQGHR